VTHEETTLDPSVDGHTDVLSQVEHALVLVFIGIGELNGLEEEGLEGLEGVLVHVVDNTELNEQEVEHGTFGSDASVGLTQVVNGDFSLLGLDLLALNLGGSSLGHFEGINQGNVGQDSVGVSIRQVLKQVRFELSKSSNELILLVDEVFFGLLEIGLLDTDDHGEELIFETRLSDNEVNDCALGGGFGLVMRVDELGLQVQLEGGHHLDFLRSDLHAEVLTLLHELTGKQGVEEGVDMFRDGFNHEHHSVREGMLNSLLPLVLVKSDNHHLGAFLTLDPLDTLKLGINKQRVSGAGVDNGGVLKRDSIGGETLAFPDSLGSFSRKDTKRVNTFCEWNFLGDNVTEPLLTPEILSEDRVKGSNVGDEGSGDEGVTNHGKLLELKSLNVGSPTDILIGETVNETVSKGE
jgi:hypothetical protein